MSDTMPVRSEYEGTAKDQIGAYISRLKAGDTGALPAVVALLALMALFASLSPFFLTKLNFTNLFVQSATLMMMSSALVFVILIAEIDLSAGVTAGTGMAIFVKFHQVGYPWPLTLAAAFVLALVTGWFIGSMVARLNVPSFVVSLALYLAFPGVMLLILGDGGVLRLEVEPVKAIMNGSLPLWGGWLTLAVSLAITAGLGLWDRARRVNASLPVRPISFLYAKVGLVAVLGGVTVYVLNLNRSLNAALPIKGMPNVIPIALALLFAGTMLLDRTRFGRHLYAVGGNPEAARRAGINVVRIRVSAFMIASTLAMISGVFNVSRIGNVESSAGRAIVLSGVAAAVLGGVSLFGGRGRLAHAAVGAFVIAIIDNGLGLIGMGAGVNYIVTGVVLLIAVTVDGLSRVRAGGSLMRN